MAKLNEKIIIGYHHGTIITQLQAAQLPQLKVMMLVEELLLNS
jgi:hypothetical protein